VTDARFLEVRSGARARRWKRIAAAVLGVVVLGGGAWLVWFSDVLAVRHVVVTGETTLSEAQVMERARVVEGRPLARTDVLAVETRVAAMERVQSVEVSRSWPRTVRIELVERTPVAWITVDGEVRGLDRFGVDFRRYDKAPKGLLEARVPVTDARQRQQTLEAVARVVAVIESRDPALRKQVQHVSAESKDSLVLNLTKGRSVTWGSAADAKRKLVVLEPLLRLDATTYDVSAPDQPTTRE
jgi:cell division protein FtsQ